MQFYARGLKWIEIEGETFSSSSERMSSLTYALGHPDFNPFGHQASGLYPGTEGHLEN